MMLVLTALSVLRVRESYFGYDADWRLSTEAIQRQRAHCKGTHATAAGQEATADGAPV